MTYNYVVDIQPESPLTGATINIASGTTHLILTPAGTLATLTINLPSTNLQEGQEVTISTSQIITIVTLGSGTIIGAITALAVGGFSRYIYNSATWYRIG